LRGERASLEVFLAVTVVAMGRSMGICDWGTIVFVTGSKVDVLMGVAICDGTTLLFVMFLGGE
jgi:hypothetical protein